MTRDQIRAALTDPLAVALTVFGEAANQPIAGQIAVGCVIRARARSPGWWGSGWLGVCLARAQFSCWWGSETDANTIRLYDAAERLLRGEDLGQPMRQLLWIAQGLIDDVLMDGTGAATHYLTAKLYREAPPSWAQGRPVQVIGDHVFLRAEALS